MSRIEPTYRNTRLFRVPPTDPSAVSTDESLVPADEIQERIDRDALLKRDVVNGVFVATMVTDPAEIEKLVYGKDPSQPSPTVEGQASSVPAPLRGILRGALLPMNINVTQGGDDNQSTSEKQQVPAAEQDDLMPKL